MDLTKDIIYRGFKLNDSAISENVTGGNGIGDGIDGCVIDTMDLDDMDVVQTMEKRSLEDGMDVGQVYRGGRRVRMSGTLYGRTRGLMYDNMMQFRAAMDPILAQADEPADFGYQPLYFSIPTNRLDEFATGYIDLRVLVMPRAFGIPISRDNYGGSEGDSLAIPWQATFVARDPRIYGEEAQDYDLGTAIATVTGDFVNRGNHYGVLNMLIAVGSGSGTISVGAGTSSFTITVPASTGDRLIRLKGDQKIITVEDVATSEEVTDMSMISFTGDNTWPQVQPGSHPYAVTFIGIAPQSGSHMWFWESYA